MTKTPIANGAEALIVSAREAREAYRNGVIPGGGQRCTVLCYVPADINLRDTLRAAIGEAADMPPLKGFSLHSERDRYVVRVERKGRTGKALTPSYKTPLAGTLIPAPPVKAPKVAAVPVKGDAKIYAADLVSRASNGNATPSKASAATQTRAASFAAAAVSQGAAAVSQGAAAVSKRGQGR